MTSDMTSQVASDVMSAREGTAGPMPLWVRVAATIIRHQPRGRYLATHWLSRWSGAPFWGRLPDDLGGMYFRCDLRDHIMREVCFTGAACCRRRGCSRLFRLA